VQGEALQQPLVQKVVPLARFESEISDEERHQCGGSRNRGLEVTGRVHDGEPHSPWNLAET